MALASDITVNPNGFGGANVATTFSFVTESNQKAIRRVTSTALTTPNTLTVQHSTRNQSGKVVDSHNIRIDLTKIDADLGEVQDSVWTNINHVRGQSAITASDLKDMFGQIADLLTETGYFDKILAGES